MKQLGKKGGHERPRKESRKIPSVLLKFHYSEHFNHQNHLKK